MRTPRPVLSAITFLAVLAFAAPVRVSAAPRVSMLERLPSGRDTVRSLGEGDAVRFVRIDDRLHATTAVGSEEPQRYLVTFAEPAGAASFAARVSARQGLSRRFVSELSRRVPGRFDASAGALPRVIQDYDRLIAGAIVLAPPRSEAALRAVPGVRDVIPDRKVTADAGENLAQVRADRVQQELGGSGLGVRVGIIDTGIDYTHSALGGGFGPGYRVAGGWDFVNHDADPRDDHGHGTHVAGIVAGSGRGVTGMAPAATLYAFKVLDQNGSGWLGDVITALERSADPDQDPGTDDRLDAVNLSLGSYATEDADPATQAVDALDALGTVVVVAAGNSGAGFTVASPGIAPGAITVGSVGATDQLSDFSSRGPTLGLRIKPDLLAPGESILSTWRDGGAASASGTSMAAPHVTGAAALLRQLHPDWTREELRSALVARAVDLARPAAEQGCGRLDAFASATATLFVSPTSLAFGRVRTDQPNWVRAETLHVHSLAAGVTDVTLSLAGATLPPWLEATMSPTSLQLDPGVARDVILTLRAIGAHPPLPDLPFIVEGALLAQADGQVCRVPFSIHEALQLRLQGDGGPPSGVVIGGGRAWPALAPFAATWLLQPGLYDILTFKNFGYDSEPFLGVTDVAVSSDTVIAIVRSTATSELTWSLRDERSSPHVPQELAVQLLHESGGGLGFLGLPHPSQLKFPVMKPGYRLEWWASDASGAIRYDIPGVERGPFSNHIVGNDPSKLRRLVEHTHVAPGDSLLLVEFPLISSGDGYFGFAGWNAFEVPFAQSFDVTRWTAPIPGPRHLRYGRTTWSANPARARAFDANPFNGTSPVWDQRHGDTLVVVPRFVLGEPLGRFTGRDMPFGSGAWFPNAWFQAYGGTLWVGGAESFVPSLFRDAAGSSPAMLPPTYELRRGGELLGSGTVDLTLGHWEMPAPAGGAFDLVLRAQGATVAGRPSATQVTVGFGDLNVCPSPEWFSIVAGGGPVERIAFGQHRDPHIELRFATMTDETPIAIGIRAGESGAWTPLAVERHGRSIRAAIPRLLGEISLRVEIGAVPTYYAPMTVEVTPAFIGEASAAANAQVIQARADAHGAHLEWRVGTPGAALFVERLEPNAGWQERGDLIVGPDGIARFDDPGVVPGGRYGYRLGGSLAEVFVEIPVAVPGLSLAVRPNPSNEGLIASITLDRDSPVTIKVHDIQGRLVMSRTWTGLGPGLHVLPVLSRGKAKPGLYFVRLEREGERRDRRVTILE